MSSGLFYLTENNFEIRNNQKGDNLCIKGSQGYSFIFFYSTKCEHCQSLIPIFKKLPGSVGGCKFGMINVSQNRGVINKSKNTKSPIEYVPYLVLYIEGEPFMRYDGPHELSEIKRFIIELAQKMSKPIKNKINKEKNKGIPSFTIGIPKNSGSKDESSYPDFNFAYEENK